jgi:hypothetical protein
MPLPNVELVKSSFGDLENELKKGIELPQYIIVINIGGVRFERKSTLISTQGFGNDQKVTVLCEGEIKPRQLRKESLEMYKINKIKNPNAMNVDGGSRRRRSRSRRSRSRRSRRHN